MKHIFLALCALIPAYAFADIIVTRSNGNIEEVAVMSVTAENVTYKKGGATKSIAASEVDGVLYDDGRYVTPPSKSYVLEETNYGNSDYPSATSGDSWGMDDAANSSTYGNSKPISYNNSRRGSDKELNILAYGKQVLNFYSADHEFDGAKVEYRVVTKYNPNPEFEYLGTTPFAYLTDTEAKILSAMDKKNASIFQVRPLIVESGGSVEFRLSKDGYNTVVVRPMVKVDFGGRMILIPLNKLKPYNGKNNNAGQRNITYEEMAGSTQEPTYNQQNYNQQAYNQQNYNQPIYEEPAPKKQRTSESSSRYAEPAYEQPVEMAVEEMPVEQPKTVAVEEEIIFKADKKYLSFSEEGGSQQVHIEARSPWEIYSSPDWTDVRKSGSTLLVNCSANTQYSDKEEDLILRNRQGQKIIIVIAQDKVADFLTLSANVINENDGEGGRYIIHVHSNKPYKVTNTPQWCRPNSFSDSLVLSIEENKSGVERQCEVEVVVSERLKKTIFVKQSPLQHYVLVSPQVVTGSKRGGIITIHVESDDKWRVVNTPDWCQISEQKDDSFRLEITPNNTGAPRSAVFSVSAYGTRKNVTVKQE